MERPLEGIRVLDCGIYHAGPGGLAILGDLGAEVIKIEQPGTGDPMRKLTRIGRLSLELPGGRSLFYEGANRNKKGITIHLGTQEGQEILYRLVKHSDVFMTNMRPKAVENLRITYPILKRFNPKLIYASVSAYGSKGPDRDQGGFDYQGQARSGLMYSMGEVDMPPVVSQFGLIDQITAIMTSHQILTALFMRERLGTGQEVHVSILGSSVFTLYFNALFAYMAGIKETRHKRSKEYPLRNYYRCRDDSWLMITLTPPDRHWGPLCRALGHPELEHDPRFDSDDKRLANAEELIALLDRIFATRPRDEWLSIFPKYDLFFSAVNRVWELHHDPQVVENGYLVDFDHPTMGKIKIPGYPIQFSDSWAGTTRAAPQLGEHTEEVLMGICKYTREDITRFMDKGII